ncbi:hypothetical protein [Nostoc sp. UHCC 0870]
MKLEPNNPLIYLARGGIYQELKSYQQALTDFNRVIELQPKA